MGMGAWMRMGAVQEGMGMGAGTGVGTVREGVGAGGAVQGVRGEKTGSLTAWHPCLGPDELCARVGQ